MADPSKILEMHVLRYPILRICGAIILPRNGVRTMIIDRLYELLS